MRYESITKTVFYFAREMARREHPLIDGVYHPDPVHEFGPRAYWATLDPFVRSEWVRRAKFIVDVCTLTYEDANKQSIEWFGTEENICACNEEVGLPPDWEKGRHKPELLCCQRCGGHNFEFRKRGES